MSTFFETFEKCKPHQCFVQSKRASCGSMDCSVFLLQNCCRCIRKNASALATPDKERKQFLQVHLKEKGTFIIHTCHNTKADISSTNAPFPSHFGCSEMKHENLVMLNILYIFKYYTVQGLNKKLEILFFLSQVIRELHRIIWLEDL